MTPERFRECLEFLGLSASAIARLLNCSDRLAYRWFSGKIAVPPGIARWLEEWGCSQTGSPRSVAP
jgi:hypothetical protein